MNLTPDSLPNSKPSGQAMAQATGQLTTQPPQHLPDFEEYLKEHRTLSHAAKAYLEPYYRQIPVFAQGLTPEDDQARFERIFRPWPKWVFRLGAELWHVNFPTIDREVFFQTFRVINAIFFRCPTNPEDLPVSTSKRDVFDRIDMDVLPLIMASFFGHAFEHFKKARTQLDERMAAGEMTPETYKEETKLASPEHIESTFRGFLGNWSKDKDMKPFELTQAVEEARCKTFDKHGKPKESPLIPVYRTMLHNWITIEKMSGPKELTHFLHPVLNDKDFFAAYDRVKQICSRMGVRFKPPVKKI